MKTVREVAELSNVSVPTLYVWYDNHKYKDCLDNAIDRALRKKEREE